MGIEHKRWAKWITFHTCCFLGQEVMFTKSEVHLVCIESVCVWTVRVCKGQQVRSYIPHKSRFTLQNIHKCAILFDLVVLYYNAANQHTASLRYSIALIILFSFATLFPTCFDLYLVVIREIFCIQHQKLPLAVHLHRTCHNNMTLYQLL